MGALHAGHLSLFHLAKRQAPAVAVSIFVNPTQFGPREDFSRYPRTMAADQKLCAAHGADVIFAPRAAEMYPEGFSTFVDETALSAGWCGAARPGHFRGVCTVVLKLFTLLAPQHAVFGRKDFQQCAVIRRMVRDLNLPVGIDLIATVREPDGLALSSRNRFLSKAERAQAASIPDVLIIARREWCAGQTSAPTMRREIAQAIRRRAPLARVDYVEIADADTLQTVTRLRPNCVIAVAVFFGKTRLIDNILLR